LGAKISAAFTHYELSEDDQAQEIFQRFSWRLKKQTKFNHFFILVLKDLSPSGKKYTTRNLKVDKTSLVAIVNTPGSHWNLEMHLKEASGTWRILKSPQFSIKIEKKRTKSFGGAMADAINALPRQTHSHQLIYSE